MSLLNRGRETVTVYPEVTVIDIDGNTINRASAVGVVARASVQPLSESENQNNGGSQTESKYRLRLVNYPAVLGAQSQVEWNGKRYSLFGDAKLYNGSSCTQRAEYTITRA